MWKFYLTWSSVSTPMPMSIHYGTLVAYILLWPTNNQASAFGSQVKRKVLLCFCTQCCGVIVQA